MKESPLEVKLIVDDLDQHRPIVISGMRALREHQDAGEQYIWAKDLDGNVERVDMGDISYDAFSED